MLPKEYPTRAPKISPIIARAARADRLLELQVTRADTLLDFVPRLPIYIEVFKLVLAIYLFN